MVCTELVLTRVGMEIETARLEKAGVAIARFPLLEACRVFSQIVKVERHRDAGVDLTIEWRRRPGAAAAG
eukprot:SAG31_NODE_467_length_15267_cov_13.792919_14_plen_70_part_00